MMPTHATELDRDALRLLQEHCDNPSGFLALNDSNQHYYAPGVDGIVFYRPAGRYWVQFGGPVAAPTDRPELLQRFLESAGRERRRVIAFQVPESDAQTYADHGFTVNQMGMSYGVELASFTLRGKKFVKLRNKISRARRVGISPAEVDLATCADAVAEIDRRWLRAKGRFTREFAFMIGQVGGAAQPLRRLFAATLAGELVGYCSYAPVYGPRPGWLHDLSRRVPDAPPGVMEAVNLFAMEQFQSEGVKWLHFGLTPFLGVAPQYAMPTASRSVDRAFRLLADKGKAVYPAQSQLDYKLKWDPSYRTPDYLAYQGGMTPALLWSAIRVLNLV